MAGNCQGDVPTVVVPELVDYVRDMLAQGFRKGEIKNALRDLCEDNVPSPRSMETVITLAKKAMVEDSGRTAEEHRGDSVEFYKSILRDKDAKRTTKLAARRQLDHILGLIGRAAEQAQDPESLALEARRFLAETHPPEDKVET